MRRESVDFHRQRAWMVASEAPEARSSHASAMRKLWNEYFRRVLRLLLTSGFFSGGCGCKIDSVSGAPAALVVNMNVVHLAAPCIGMSNSMSRRAFAAALAGLSMNGRYIGLNESTNDAEAVRFTRGWGEDCAVPCF